MSDIEKALQRALVERVAASVELSNSPKLRAFFLYVVDCALRDCPEDATEQQIGIQVFGRQPGYNSSEDSAVRSQARLLRLKLASYFSTEGANEPLVIEMPKGHYFPVFRERFFQFKVASPEQLDRDESEEAFDELAAPLVAENQASKGTSAEELLNSRMSAPTKRFILTPHIGYTVLLAIAVLAGVWSCWYWAASRLTKPDPLWSPFWAKDRQTLVIYSNPLFTGTPSEGLRVVDSAHFIDRSEVYDESYSGTGEVAAVSHLTHFFDAHNASFLLKRSRLVTWDEAKSENLIFVGAPSQNSALQDLPALTEFSIVQDQSSRGSIVNHHPRPGEPVHFPADDKTQDTAIIAFLPGLEPGTKILIFSGLTTIGTQMAVEYACAPENAAALAQLAGVNNGEIRPFEAVLHIGISKGVGIKTQLLFLHRH
jgi:hypothetical protein